MFTTRIGNRELSVLCERVGVAFDVGHDPYRIFEREANGRSNLHGRQMQAVADKVKQGASLTEAVESCGNYFPPNFKRLIEVGEESGKLEKVLHRMGEYYGHMAQLKDELIGSITWPLIQLVLGLIVVSVLIYVPSVVAPESADAADLLGIGLIGIPGLLTFWAYIAGIVAAIVAVLLLMRNGYLGFIGDALTRLPILGKALMTFDEAAFIQSLSLAIESGVSASKAIVLSFKSASSSRFKAKAEEAHNAVRGGQELHDVLKNTGLFSQDTIEAVQLGEESGRLAETLDKHYHVLKSRVRFAMNAITQLASSVIWILISALLIAVIFRVFSRYVSVTQPEAVERMFNPGGAPNIEP
jgi:type II secretory pathway component PulF